LACGPSLGRRAQGRRGLGLEFGSGTVERKGMTGGFHLSVAAGGGGGGGGGGAGGWRCCWAGWAAMRCWATTVDQVEKTRGSCEHLLIGPKAELG
jgi:hypothetical protein